MAGSIFNNLTNSVFNNINEGPVGNVLSGLGVFNSSSGGYRSNFVVCFDESTEILCLNDKFEEVYVPISQLTKGSIVKTFKHGYRRLELIYTGQLMNNIDDYRNCMYVLPKNENMTKDLIVTGGHAILVDSMSEKENIKNLEYFAGFKLEIDGKQLLLSAASDNFIALDNTNIYNYYHFILENDGDDDVRYGVWANGVLTETPSKNFLCEIMLHNVISNI
jgi:hypothetical protein